MAKRLSEPRKVYSIEKVHSCIGDKNMVGQLQRLPFLFDAGTDFVSALIVSTVTIHSTSKAQGKRRAGSSVNFRSI